jgi:flagellin
MISINTNASSSLASLNLQKSSDLLQKSLARLSSGNRISTTSDDAGGVAVAMKMSAAVKRTQSTSLNVSNALSLLQVQAGTLKSAASVLDRLSELATLAGDVTKSSADIGNYSTEYTSLVSELSSLYADKFNGVSLFSSQNKTLTVYISQDGTQTMNLSRHDLTSVLVRDTAGTVFARDLKKITGATGSKLSTITSAIQALATMMATNGAESSRVQFALDSLNVNQVNLEAALSRIQDVDVATETAKLARANILVQAGAAMLTQANASQSIALKLLQ